FGGGRDDFLFVSVGSRNEFFREPLREGAAPVVGKFAVGQRERLLRDDSFDSPVAFHRFGWVEQFGELAVPTGFRIALEVETAVSGLLGLGVREWVADGRQIEFAGEVKKTVADNFSFHLPGIHAPEIAVFGIALLIRRNRRD